MLPEDYPDNYHPPAQGEQVEEILLVWHPFGGGQPHYDPDDIDDYLRGLAIAIANTVEEDVRIICGDDGETPDLIEDYLLEENANMDNITIDVWDEDDVPAQGDFKLIWVRDYGGVPMIDEDTGELFILNPLYHALDREIANDFPINYAQAKGVDVFDMQDEEDTWFMMDGGHKFVKYAGYFYATKDIYELGDNDDIDVDELVKQYFGLSGRDDRIINIVDGEEFPLSHLDMQINIIEDTVIVNEVDETEHPEMAKILDDTAYLFNNMWVTRDGKDFDVHRVYSPVVDDTLYAHSNSLQIGNYILVPTYNQGTDTDAIETYETAFPEHTIVGVDSEACAELGGAVHCTTREIPESNIPAKITIKEFTAEPEEDVIIEVEVETEHDIEDVEAYLHFDDQYAPYNYFQLYEERELDLTHVEGNTYEATENIGSFPDGTILGYFVRVRDGNDAMSYDGDAWQPHLKDIGDVPEQTEEEEYEFTGEKVEIDITGEGEEEQDLDFEAYRMEVRMLGAGGGGGFSGSGGDGGLLEGLIDVSEFDKITLYVGGAGEYVPSNTERAEGGWGNHEGGDSSEFGYTGSGGGAVEVIGDEGEPTETLLAVADAGGGASDTIDEGGGGGGARGGSGGTPDGQDGDGTGYGGDGGNAVADEEDGEDGGQEVDLDKFISSHLHTGFGNEGGDLQEDNAEDGFMTIMFLSEDEEPPPVIITINVRDYGDTINIRDIDQADVNSNIRAKHL